MSSAASSPAHSVASGSTGIAANDGQNDSFKFSAAEKVFCFHGPLIYDARCVKAKLENGKPIYLIHYHGWSKNWDEWVDENRILVYNDDSKKMYEQSNMKKKCVTPRGAGQKRKSASANSLSSSSESTPTTSTTGGGLGKVHHGKVAKTTSSSASADSASPSVTTTPKSETVHSKSGKHHHHSSSSTAVSAVSSSSSSLALHSSSSLSTPTATLSSLSKSATNATSSTVSSSKLLSSLTDSDSNVEVKDEDVKDNVVISTEKTSQPQSQTTIPSTQIHHQSASSTAVSQQQQAASVSASAAQNVKKPRKRNSKLLRQEISEMRLMPSGIGASIKITIPEPLKQILVDDMDYINNKSMLVELPAVHNINDILDGYIKHRSETFLENFHRHQQQQQQQQSSSNGDSSSSSDSTNQDNPPSPSYSGNIAGAPFSSIMLHNDDLNLKLDNFGHRFYRSCLTDVCNGIRNYFNVLAGTQLLYKFERLQYREQLKQLIVSVEAANKDHSETGGKQTISYDNNGSDSESKSNNNNVEQLSMDTENSSSSTSSLVINHHKKQSGAAIKKLASKSGKGAKHSGKLAANSQDNCFFRSCNNQTMQLCSVYGFTHLLRLFTLLGRIISGFQLDQGIVDTLVAIFEDLLNYLNQHRKELYDPEQYYTNVSQEYFRTAL